MSIRSVLAACAVAAVAVAASGCASTIDGTPLAAAPAEAHGPSAATSADPAAPGTSAPLTASEPLELPSTGEESMPTDLSGLMGGLGDGPIDPSSLSDLINGLQGSAGTGLGDLGSVISPECLSVAGASMTLGMLMLAPAMGQPLTQAQVDKAFAGLTTVPPELRSSVDALRATAEKAVGMSAADATALMSSNDVTEALDHVTTYLDAHCSGK